jgi:hypothetical protein
LPGRRSLTATTKGLPMGFQQPLFEDAIEPTLVDKCGEGDSLFFVHKLDKSVITVVITGVIKGKKPVVQCSWGRQHHFTVNPAKNLITFESGSPDARRVYKRDYVILETQRKALLERYRK